jgi:hypothetical protein
MTDDQETTWHSFQDTVNMTARELEKWLDTEELKSVGQKQGGDESTGHASGRHIVEILKAKRGDLTDADYARMRKWSASPDATWRNVRTAKSTTVRGDTP